MRPDPLERLVRAQRRMAPGTLGGRVENATPVRRVGRGELITRGIAEQPFSYAGVLTASTSPRWYPPRGITVLNVFGSLGTAGTSTTTVNVRRNGTTIATLTFGSGAQTATDTTITTPDLAADTDYITTEIATVGSGSPANLDVQVRFL